MSEQIASTFQQPDNREGQAFTAPTIWQQLGGVFTEPTALFKRLAVTPRWGQALVMMFVVGWVMMTCWGWKVDVDAMQRPVLEQRGGMTEAQIDQAIAVSSRFIIPMSIVSVVLRNLVAVLGLGLLMWLFTLTTDRARKTTFLHALSAATVPNLVLIPYTLMIAVMCMIQNVGGKIPERMAPSGLAYYVRPESQKLYALFAQLDLFVIGYFALLALAIHHTMRLRTKDTAILTTIVVALSVGWKVYFWV